MPNTPVRLLKVFLCHASGDKPPVRDLYRDLVAEGVDAWLDQEKLLPGQNWRSEIPKAVHEADVVVVCLSKKSITKEGYVQKEIKFALDIAEEKPEDTIFLIPARLEECDVPERLSLWQWVDLYEENGFVKLMCSLKLRADAVEATIRPSSSEDADQEQERRIKQLYTEGLAAFYTEDWEKACRRFRSILSEQPGHRNAVEKLAEAERQRELSRLYAQALDAVRSEDWGSAIKILEGLSRQTPAYKDVDHLLENARKQEQLKDLYAEAKALFDAQEWDAVIKVFGQISAIEPDHPDPDGLLPSAQKEAAKFQRLASLNGLYETAVDQMESGHWMEARRLLEKIHKSQAGFLETERLLRKVDEELRKEGGHSRQNGRIGALQEQVRTRFPPVRVILIIGGLAVLTLAAVWIIPLVRDALNPVPTPLTSATDVVFTKPPATPSLTMTAENTPQLLEYKPRSWVDGSALIHVPQGEFVMGASEDVGAQNMVALDEFWIYRTEVTNSMYSRCVAAGICTPPFAKDYNTPFHANEPVVNVTWDQADTYCKWLGARLPTETEWEKAARGPDGNIYPWGSEPPDCSLLNFNGCIGMPNFVSDYPAGGSYYGVMDMAGNVFEWVADWYSEGFPGGTPAAFQDGEYRSVRGSGFLSDEQEVNLTNRSYLPPGEYRDDLGFRCAVDDPEVYPPACSLLPIFVQGTTDLPETEKCPALYAEVVSQVCSRELQYINIDIPEDNDGYRVLSLLGEHEVDDVTCSASQGIAERPNELRLTCGGWGSKELPKELTLAVCKFCSLSEFPEGISCLDGYEFDHQASLCYLIAPQPGGACPQGFELNAELGCCQALSVEINLETGLRYCDSSTIPLKAMSCSFATPPPKKPCSSYTTQAACVSAGCRWEPSGPICLDP